MQKAIHTDGSAPICRILSITDAQAAETSPNGLAYILTEYVDPPTLTSSMDIAYPMYNTVTGAMYWQVVNYQNAATDMLLANQALQAQVTALQGELEAAQLALDDLLMGGVDDGRISGGQDTQGQA